jgi:hypothetical protein
VPEIHCDKAEVKGTSVTAWDLIYALEAGNALISFSLNDDGLSRRAPAG